MRIREEKQTMLEWEYQGDDRYLFGFLIIRTLDRTTGNPLPNVRVGVGDDLKSACGDK